MPAFCNIELEFVEPDGGRYDVGDRVAFVASVTDRDGQAVSLSGSTVEARYRHEDGGGAQGAENLSVSGNEITGDFPAPEAGCYDVRVQVGGDGAAHEGAEEREVRVYRTRIDPWTIGGVTVDTRTTAAGDTRVTASGDTRSTA